MNSFDILLEDYEFAYLCGLTQVRYVVGFHNRFANWLPEEWSTLQKRARYSLRAKGYLKEEPVQIAGPLAKTMQTIAGARTVYHRQSLEDSTYFYESDSFCHITLSSQGTKQGVRLLRKNGELIAALLKPFEEMGRYAAAAFRAEIPDDTYRIFKQTLTRKGPSEAAQLLCDELSQSEATLFAQELTHTRQNGIIQRLTRSKGGQWTSESLAFLLTPGGIWECQAASGHTIFNPIEGKRLQSKLVDFCGQSGR
ncbi:hypothetical protein JST97_20235 [bacterium]|nr:hypothetical protein [bacterium]